MQGRGVALKDIRSRSNQEGEGKIYCGAAQLDDLERSKNSV